MSEQEDKKILARDRLIRDRFIPKIERGQHHVTINVRDIEELYAGIDHEYILEYLGSEWWAHKLTDDSNLIIFIHQMDPRVDISEVKDKLAEGLLPDS